MGNNLTSPNTISASPNLANLSSWFEREIAGVDPAPLSEVLHIIGASLSAFVRFPEKAILLWHGCDRVVPTGQKTKYHSYPQALKDAAKTAGVYLDARANGPAIAAFQMGGGDRPARFGSSNAWSVHHPYSGKFPFPGRESTTHAAKCCEHFTQSAGLIAVHPLADALCDELPAFAWLLRAEAFRRFSYDPDRVFSTDDGGLGFAQCAKVEVLHASA